VRARNGSLDRERTQDYAEGFLQEMREVIETAARSGLDSPPRLRSVHERPGHSTPEFRTVVIPAPPGAGVLSPPTLSVAIARFAARRPPDRLVLALDALQDDGSGGNRPVLLAEARDCVGTRLFWAQSYRVEDNGVRWDDPQAGGWVDPGAEEMILDAAFQLAR
jgi:hypothetical protein